jgi:hypothetical protein
MQPHVDVEVSDTEYVDLKRQGLLVEDEDSKPEPAAAPAAAPAKPQPVAAKTSKE